MKALIILIIGTMTLFAAAPAGTYCVDVGNDVTRVEKAFGDILGLKDVSGNPRPATTAEIEAAIFNWVEGQTHDYERRANMTSFTPPPFINTAKYAPKAAIAATPKPTATPKKK